MTIKDILSKYKDIEIEILLETILNKPKEFLYVHSENKLTPIQLAKLKTLLSKRKKGVPIAYLLGYKYFYGHKFKVSKDTLIPRPETEQLIDLILASLITHKGESLKILDMGTGSGVIAIMLDKAISKSKIIHAADISAKALTVAKQNSKSHKAKIKFIKSNLFKNIQGKYDLIVANLPYVPVNFYKKNLKDLKYEPKLALTDNTNTGKLILEFIKQSKNHLTPAGQIFLEIDPKITKSIRKTAKLHLPNHKIFFLMDLNKLTRFTNITP